MNIHSTECNLFYVMVIKEPTANSSETRSFQSQKLIVQFCMTCIRSYYLV